MFAGMYYYIRKSQNILSKELHSLFKKVSTEQSNNELTADQEIDFLSADKVTIIILLIMLLIHNLIRFTLNT